MFKRSIASVLALALAATLACGRAQAQSALYWGTYQGNAAHNGYVPVTLNPASFSTAWQDAMGSGLYPIAEASGQVFATQGTTLSALNAATGSTLWQTALTASSAPASPAYANGTVYVENAYQIPGGYVAAYSASSGKQLFSSSIACQWESYYAPTPYGGNVYVGGGEYGGMYAFNGTSGSMNWFGGVAQYDGWTPAVSGSYAYAYTGNGDITPIEGQFTVINLATGAAAATVYDPVFSWSGYTMDSAVALGSQSDAFTINGGRLACWSTTLSGTNTPHIAWSATDNYAGQPSVAGGVVYAIDGGNLKAINESTGAVAWTWIPPSGSLSGTMIVTNNEILASTGAATYEINLKTHQQDWYYPDGGSLALSENKLYIVDSSGNLTAINTFFLPTPSVWGVAGSGSWATAGNWSPAGPAGGIDGTADFSQQALAANATVTLDGSRTIGYLLFGDTAAAHNWTLSAGTGGTLTLQVTATSGCTPTITVNNQTATINTAVAGTQGLVKAGSGTLVLTASNTYSGGTFISAGNLAVAADSSLGIGPVTITAGALEVTGSIVSPRSLALAGSAATVQVDAGGNYNATAAASVSGSGGLTKTGPGTLNLASAATSYSGPTSVAAGVLDLGSLPAGNAISVSTGATANVSGSGQNLGSMSNAGNLNFTASTGTTTLANLTGSGNSSFAAAASFPTLSGGSVTIAGQAAIGTVSGGTVNFNGPNATIASLGNAAVNLGNGTSLNVSSGFLSAGAITGPGSLNLVGPGILVLAASTSFAGGTTISAGTLQLGNGGTAGSIVGNVTDNALLAFDRGDLTCSFSGNIGGNGSIVQSGGGVLILAGSNSYGGATTVTSGTLQFASAAALPPTSPLSVAAGAAINLNGVNLTASAIGGSGIVALGAATLTLSDTTTTLLSAQVVGAGSLVKNGPGTLVLTASEGYTGGTTISAGALQVGNGVAAGSLLGNLLDNGQLVVDRTGASSFGGSIAGTGSLATIGGGLLTLAGSNGYSGGTTVSAGTLQLGAAGAYPAATPLTVAAGATFNLNGFACTVSGIGGSGAVTLGNTTLTLSAGSPASVTATISGSGGIVKTGSGDLTIASVNSYLGPTTSQAGRLIVTSDGPTSAYVAAAGGTLQLAGAPFNLGTRSIRAQAGGSIEYNGAGVSGGYLRGPGVHETIAGNNSFTAVTTYNSTNFQQNAATTLTNFTNGGTLANNFPLTWDGGVNAGTGNFVVSSTANVDDWNNQGAVTVAAGGVLNNSQATLVSSGGGIITVMSAGQINPAADNGGETLDLHDSLLVNDGLVNGLTNVYYGSMAEGTGTYGQVHVFQGGSFAAGDPAERVFLDGSLALDPGAALDFDLGPIDQSGLILAPGNLLTLSGQDFESMDFTPEPGFSLGTYTLIEAQEIDGGIGVHDSGLIDGLPASLSMQGNDLVLTVVPEPSSVLLLAAAALGIAGFWRLGHGASAGGKARP
jgi:autotransporter-associated beta strand protein